jgi:hypothetical protein
VEPARASPPGHDKPGLTLGARIAIGGIGERQSTCVERLKAR